MDVILSAATHRSGSTLLQRIFNARQQTLVWGEHLGVLRDFHKIEQKVRKMSKQGEKSRQSYFGNGENPNQWLAVMAPSPEFIRKAIVDSVRMFLTALYDQQKAGHDLIGFKEVRYGAHELSILQECYPSVKFALLVRSPIKAWESYPKRWGEYRSCAQFARQWNNNVSYYLQLAKQNPNAYLIRYEDLIAREKNTVQTLMKLAQITEAELESVLAEKIGGTRKKKPISSAQAVIIKRICRTNMKLLRYL